MDCPLCGTENTTSAKRCQLCDTPLQADARAEEANAPSPDTIFIDTVDASRMQFSRRKILIATALVTLLTVPWLFMSSLLSVPDDVAESRTLYEKVHARYVDEQASWSKQKDQILAAVARKQKDDPIGSEPALFEGLPLEVALAYLYEDLGMGKNTFTNVAIYPNTDLSNPTFIVSKYQKGMWPLKILLSLEVRLRHDQGAWVVEYQRLRRGSRDISPALAWVYFLPELKLLSKLEALGGGARSLSLFRPASGNTPPQLSWSYRPRQSMPVL